MLDHHRWSLLYALLLLILYMKIDFYKDFYPKALCDKGNDGPTVAGTIRMFFNFPKHLPYRDRKRFQTRTDQHVHDTPTDSLSRTTQTSIANTHEPRSIAYINLTLLIRVSRPAISRSTRPVTTSAASCQRLARNFQR